MTIFVKDPLNQTQILGNQRNYERIQSVDKVGRRKKVLKRNMASVVCRAGETEMSGARNFVKLWSA